MAANKQLCRITVIAVLMLVGVMIVGGCAGESESARAPSALAGSSTSTAEPATASSGIATPATPPPVANGCVGDGPRVCLVPLGDYADPSVGSLAQYLVEQGIPAGSTASVKIESTSGDDREPLSAAKAATRVAAFYPELVADPQVTVIALTDLAVFVFGEPNRFFWGVADFEVAVVSTSRMYQDGWGGSRSTDLRDSRARKLLLRYVGLIHLGLPMNDSPLSVLYEGFDGSLTGFDTMYEGVLDPNSLPTPSPAVRRWAVDFCVASQEAAVVESQAWSEVFEDLTFELTIEDARNTTFTYLDHWRASLVQHESALDNTYKLVEAWPAVEASVRWSALEELLQLRLERMVADIDAARPEIGRLGSTAEVIYRFRELTRSEFTLQESVEFFEAFDALPLEARVALVAARPCGLFV